MADKLEPCPFCGKAMMFRAALWPSEGDRDGIIHAEPTDCPLGPFENDTADESIIELWNHRASPAAAGVEGEAVAVAFRISAPDDDHYGRGPDSLQFHPLADHDRECGYTAEPLYPASAIESLQRELRSTEINRSAWEDSARINKGRADEAEARARRMEEALREARTLLAGPLVGAEWKRACHDFIVKADAALSSSPAAEPVVAGQGEDARQGLQRIHETILTQMGSAAIFPRYPDTWAAWAEIILNAAVALDRAALRPAPVVVEDWVCQICDGGPGNHCACTCPDGPVLKAPAAGMEAAAEARTFINGPGHKPTGPFLTWIADRLQHVHGENPNYDYMLRLREIAALPHLSASLSGECATDGCSLPATIRFERGGVGSHYCQACYLRVQALSSAPRGQEGGEG